MAELGLTTYSPASEPTLFNYFTRQSGSVIVEKTKQTSTIIKAFNVKTTPLPCHLYVSVNTHTQCVSKSGFNQEREIMCQLEQGKV